MSSGSHGGEDHYVIADSAEIERLVVRDVRLADREAFRTELAEAAPYEKNPRHRARVQLAMLYLADGDLARLRQARRLADADWRDVLMQAEYPSTPGYGTKETPEQRRKRQRRDAKALATWRNRR